MFDSATAEEQRRYDNIIEEICEDPWLDPPIKDRFIVPPAVISLYHNGERWAVYDLPDDATVRIWMMGSVPAEPRPY